MIIDSNLIDEIWDFIRKYPFQITGLIIGLLSFQLDFLSIDILSRKHLIAIILGPILGHLFERYLDKQNRDPLIKLEKLKGKRRNLFMRTLFSVMGHIAKADGRVSEDEIKVARGIMAELSLNKDEIATAIKAFTNGKSTEFPLADNLNTFQEQFRFNIGLRERFYRVQIQAVLAGDGISRVVDNLLHATAAQLDIPNSRVQELLREARIYNSFTVYGRKTEKTHYERQYEYRSHRDKYKGQQQDESFHNRQRHEQYRNNQANEKKDELAEAYILLGVSAADNVKAIKRAYRRLISQYHPDKVTGKGGNTAERELANAKTIEIRKAYEMIKKARGFK